MKVGDKAYIIESGRKIREVELVGVAGDGFIVRFTDTGGGIAVNSSRICKLEEAEAKAGKSVAEKKDVPNKAKAGYHYWEVGA